MTSPPFKKLKPWHLMLKHRGLEEVTLQPGNFLSDREIKDKYKHTYLDPKQFARLGKEGRTIEKSTLFWYPAGVYDNYPTELYGGEKREIAGVYLQGVIRREVQDEAFAALEQMKWAEPKRPETKTAVGRQKGNKVEPKELTIGVTHPRNKPNDLMPSVDTRKNADHLRHLIPLWKEVAGCFQKVLPAYSRLQNSPGYVSLQDPDAPAQPLPDYGGIPRELRNWLGPENGDAMFSTLTLLRSCPASVHKDRNANKDQHNFACLTSLGDKDKKGKLKFSGGRFCLIEYGLEIPILPGDLFIGQTTREWHYNTTPVTGVKYSMIGYYQPRLAKPDKDRSRLEPPKEEHGLGAVGGDPL
jgi:hypothetical protein